MHHGHHEHGHHVAGKEDMAYSETITHSGHGPGHVTERHQVVHRVHEPPHQRFLPPQVGRFTLRGSEET